jgi:hypothetical protein
VPVESLDLEGKRMITSLLILKTIAFFSAISSSSIWYGTPYFKIRALKTVSSMRRGLAAIRRSSHLPATRIRSFIGFGNIPVKGEAPSIRGLG